MNDSKYSAAEQILIFVVSIILFFFVVQYSLEFAAIFLVTLLGAEAVILLIPVFIIWVCCGGIDSLFDFIEKGVSFVLDYTKIAFNAVKSFFSKNKTAAA